MKDDILKDQENLNPKRKFYKPIIQKDMVITIKGKLMACFMICLVVHIPLSYATSPSWGYRIDEISVSVMTKDGNKVLVGTSSGTYYLFNEHGEIIGQENLVDEIMSVDISEESMILGTESATFILSSSGRKILNLPGKSVLSVAISENESCAISGNDGNIFIFPSLRSSKQINIGNPVNHVSISSDGEQAAAATSDTVFFLTIDENVTLYEFSIPYITSMQLSRDGKFLVVGTKEGSLYLLERGRELLFKKDLTGSVTSVEMSGNTILACTSVGKIHLFDLTGTEIQHVTIDEILDCDISLDGRFIIAANSQELHMLSEYGEILWQKDIDNIKSVEISSDGKYVTAVTSDGIFFFCNWTDTFREVYYYPNPSKEHYSFDNFKEMWDYPVSFVENPHNRQPNHRAAVGDVNGDGENEIVISAGKDLVVLDSERNIISEKNYTKEVLNVALMDLNNDIVPEIVYTFSDGKYGVFVMDARKEELEEISEFDFSYYFGVSTKEKKEGGIIPVVSYDIDGDGKTEILAVVCSGYTLKPRGILAFEYPSGDIEWFYESAPLLIFDAFYDIDGDGNPEIILGSHSCSNGNTVGDRDDCHAYLTVLDLDGKEVWNKEIGPEFKVIRAGAGDVNKDGEVEIVGTVFDANNIGGELFVMDNKGNILKEREFSASFSLGGIVDFDGDGYMEIVTTDSDGNIRIFNFELESIESREIAPYQRSEVEGITDMDGDGDKEIILRVQEDRLIVLDGNLEEKWSKEFENLRPVVLVTNVSGCGNDLLVLTEKTLELYSFEGEEEYLCAPEILLETPPPTTPPPPTIAPPATTPEPTTPPTETPEPTTPPTETPEPTTPPTETPDKWNLEKIGAICSIIGLIGIPLTLLIFQLGRKAKKEKEKPSFKEEIVSEEPIKKDFEFDIAISFAGEDREIAEELADELQTKGVEVFYDRYFKGKLWGKELTKYFQDVYGPKTRFVVLLLSKHYPVKKWTGFEFFIMREEAEKRKTEFILPVKLDNTKMKGIKDDVAYLDYQEEGIEGIVGCLLEKLPKALDQEPYKENEK